MNWGQQCHVERPNLRVEDVRAETLPPGGPPAGTRGDVASGGFGDPVPADRCPEQPQPEPDQIGRTDQTQDCVGNLGRGQQGRDAHGSCHPPDEDAGTDPERGCVGRPTTLGQRRAQDQGRVQTGGDRDQAGHEREGANARKDGVGKHSSRMARQPDPELIIKSVAADNHRAEMWRST